MQIKINTQSFELRPDQEAMITKKLEHLAQLGSRLDDESTHVKVDFIHEASRSQADAYQCHATFFAPHETLRAEARSSAPENAFDEVVDKLRTQIERYKAKLHHTEKRKP